MHDNRLFEYEGHWLVQRTDTPNLNIYWCKPGSRRVRRKSTHTSDLEHAKAVLVDFVHSKKRPRDGDPDTVSVHDALNEYVTTTLAGRPSQERARYTLRCWDQFLDLKELQFVDEITLDIQEQFIAWRREIASRRGASLSNGTIKRDLDVLRASLRHFCQRGYLREVPYVRSLPAPPPRERFLSEEEVGRLLEECHAEHLRLFVLLGIHTLQRPGAILQLRVEQVDLKRRRIDFLPAGTAQSNKRKPVVPISRTLAEPLEQAIAESERGFVVEWDGVPITCIRHSFKRACKRAGLADVSPYTLRHTGATLLAGAGVPMRQVAGMLGHSQMRTTERYAKHAPEFLEGAIDALDEMFGGGGDGVRAKRAPESRYPQVIEFPQSLAG